MKFAPPELYVMDTKSTIRTVVVPLAGLVALYTFMVADLRGLHKSYRGERGQFPQGTIYAVQSVETNIAASSFPYSISSLLKSNNFEEINRLLNTAYGLFGFVVTDCVLPKGQGPCEDYTILARTGQNSYWMTDEFLRKSIARSHYSVLTDSMEPGQDWRYKAPKNEKIMEMPFEPQGTIIGRLHYIKRPKPEFNSQFYSWLASPFNQSSTDRKYYLSIATNYFFAWIIFVALFLVMEKFVRKRRQTMERNAELLEALEGNAKDREVLQKEIGEKERALSNNEQRILYLQSEKNEASSVAYDLIAEKQELEKLSADQGTQLISLKNQLNELNAEKAILENRVARSGKGNSVFEALISGINIKSPILVSYSQKVSEKDIPRLISEGYSVQSVENLLRNILRTSRESGEFGRRFQKLKNIEGVFHNKAAKIRIYFTVIGNEIFIGAVYSQENAPHAGSSNKWNRLAARFKEIESAEGLEVVSGEI